MEKFVNLEVGTILSEVFMVHKMHSKASVTIWSSVFDWIEKYFDKLGKLANLMKWFTWKPLPWMEN